MHCWGYAKPAIPQLNGIDVPKAPTAFRPLLNLYNPSHIRAERDGCAKGALSILMQTENCTGEWLACRQCQLAEKVQPGSAACCDACQQIEYCTNAVGSRGAVREFENQDCMTWQCAERCRLQLSQNGFGLSTSPQQGIASKMTASCSAAVQTAIAHVEQHSCIQMRCF